MATLVLRRVERGELTVGSALPSERDLARRLAVSRASVVRALQLLRGQGVVSTRHGAGSVVAPSDRLLDPVAPTPSPSGGAPIALDLRAGTTAAPHEVEVATRRLAADPLRAAMAGDGPPAGGSPALRAALAEQLTASGVPTLPGQLTLTSGAAAGLELVLQLVVKGPGAALSESPTYPAALACLRRHRLEISGWPAGLTGWDTDQLAHLIRRRRPVVAYVQADNHNPTGLSLAGDRRPAVVELLRRQEVTLVSDETLRPLWFGAGTQPAALSRHPGVVSLGSLSKTVWGGLRVGWVRASQDFTGRLHRLPSAAVVAPGALDELLAGEILADLVDIVERRRRILDGNLATLAAGLSGLRDVAWERPSGGMTAWLELQHADAHRVAAQSRRLGLLVSPGDLYTPDGNDRRHLRIPFTSSPAQLAAAVAILDQAVAAASV